VSAPSDLAELSSLSAQLEELCGRVAAIATRYQGTPDSAVSVDLFEAERALISAGRVLRRALTSLGELAG